MPVSLTAVSAGTQAFGHDSDPRGPEKCQIFFRTRTGLAPYALERMSTDDTQAPSLVPEGIFVLHLRSDSAAEREHLVGRVEHVKSGDVEAFASVAALLGFIERHVAPAACADRGRESNQ